MKELITALLNSYPNTDNRPTEFGTYVIEQCQKITKSSYKFVNQCYNTLNEFNSRIANIPDRIKKKTDSPVKIIIEQETKQIKEELYNKIIQNTEKILNDTIDNIINNFNDVNNFDLTDINLQERIIKSLKQFQPKNLQQKEFHDALLAKLPQAIKVYGLSLITQEYLNYLDTKITNLIPRNFKPYMATESFSRTEQYINKFSKGEIQSSDVELQIAIEKYNAVSIIKSTLTNNNSNERRLNSFNAVFAEKKEIIAKSRDGYAKVFLKKVMDFFTGYKFHDWFWNSRGKEVGQKITSFYTSKINSTQPPTVARRLVF